jgi:hypothetical protein
MEGEMAMTSENVPPEMSPALSTETPPARIRIGKRRRLGRIGSTLLVAGAALQVVTLLLPWDHLAIPSEHAAFDFPVSAFITDVPFQEVIFAFGCPADVTACPHLTLAAIFWDVLWRGALLFIGPLLVLACLAVRRVALRWSFAVLFGLWLLYTTGLTVSFVTTAYAIDTLGDNAPNQPSWWPSFFRVGVPRAGTSGNPVTPAWGFWFYLAALALCWLALGLTIASLLRKRSENAAGAEGEEPTRARKAPLAAILVTGGAIIWLISLAGLPLVVADCSRPLVPMTPTEVHELCLSAARVYPLQVSVVNYLYLDAVPAQPISLAEQGMPGPTLLGMLKYFRDFELLVLAVVATPLALVAMWRRMPERGLAAWLSAWVVLGLVGTGFLLWGLRELLSPNPPLFVRPVFAVGFGPGAVLAPLGMVVMLAGVMVYWLHLRRDGLWPTRATKAV